MSVARKLAAGRLTNNTERLDQYQETARSDPMRPDDIPRIRALPLFRDMSEVAFAEMLQAAYLQRFPPQVQLVSEGDPADFLYIVVDGAVEMFASANNRETTMMIVEPVATFILAAVLKDAVYLMSARTLMPSRVLMIPSEDLRAAMDKDSAFATAMVRELATRYRGVIKQLKNQKLRTAVERLANYLLHLKQVQGDGEQIELPADKRTVAALLGMAPENLSRAFATLKPYGVLVDGSQVSLTTPADLERLAKPTPLIDDPNI